MNIEKLSPQTVLVVKDLKPTALSSNGKPILFTITKAGYLQLIMSHKDRYAVVDEYRSKQQLKSKTPDIAKEVITPKIVDVAGGIITSREMKAAEAIEQTKTIDNIDKLNLFSIGEDRVTVKDAILSRQLELQAE